MYFFFTKIRNDSQQKSIQKPNNSLGFNINFENNVTQI